MSFLLLTFIVPVAGVGLLQVDRQPKLRRAHKDSNLLLIEDAEDGKETVELLRFVTPYKTPMETVVDITPYSQLIHSLLQAPSVEFYVAIDTWVSNDTRKKLVYISNTSDSCSSVWSSQGNAWNVSLDLVQWPRTILEPIQPRATILLAESFPNPLMDIGQVKAYEGTLMGDLVTLNSGVALGPLATVYPCPSGADTLKKEALLGSYAQEAEQLVLEAKHLDANTSKNITARLEAEYLQDMVSDQMIDAKILTSKGQDLEILLSSNSSKLTKDLPVYLAPGSTVSDQPYTSTVWFNMSLPFQPLGYIKEIYNDTHVLMNVTKHHCILSLNSSSLPGLQVPKDKYVIPTATKKLDMVVAVGIASGKKLREDHSNAKESLLLLNASYSDGKLSIKEKKPLGRIDSKALGRSELGETKVCVVQKNTQGHVFSRQFEPNLQVNERAILHLTITGHGWAATSESCGEYCHAIYHLHLNGQNFANVTQWRDDCYLNPGGPAQHGTWYESRNGWCPGSVEPGIYIDVTEHLDKTGRNEFSLNLTVWQNLTHRYALYTDISGFIQNDVAMLAVTANVLLYGSYAVTAVLTAPQAFSKAEAALRDGCSDPEKLKPPKVVHFLSDDFASSDEARKENEEQVIDTCPPSQVPFDFETRAPWYFYNHSKEILPGKPSGAKYLPVIDSRLVQINTRTVTGQVDSLKFQGDWQQLALRFRLMNPEFLEMDRWDRVGSVGVMIPKTLQNVQIRTSETSPTPSSSKYWRMST